MAGAKPKTNKAIFPLHHAARDIVTGLAALHSKRSARKMKPHEKGLSPTLESHGSGPAARIFLNISTHEAIWIKRLDVRL